VEDWLVMTRQQQLSWIAAATLALSACTVPAPQTVPPRPTPVPPPQEQAPVETQPAPQPEPPLSAASRALVGQAQSQMASKNYAVAAASIERALRIEPDNALLWIELGKVRQSEGNYVQAENMGRKAVQMSANAPRANSAAWSLIAESLRARGKNVEAQAAEARANALR
jgi:tetratricopeptide (TPR) repeat protein